MVTICFFVDLCDLSLLLKRLMGPHAGPHQIAAAQSVRYTKNPRQNTGEFVGCSPSIRGDNVKENKDG